jgi:hypothetical protein
MHVKDRAVVVQRHHTEAVLSPESRTHFEELLRQRAARKRRRP